MHRIRLLSRIRDIALPCALLIALQACGSSATSVTSPTSITRCGITMQPVDGPLPADGGSAVISVTAARECAWSATVEGAWLTLKSGANGQGDGTVEFAATANPDPVMRRGAIVANGQRADISQAAGECSLSLAASSASISQAGGSGQIQVRASSGMCSWTAAVDVEWVQLRNTSGQGNAVVTFEVPASTGPPRNATITVAGQKFSIIQSEGCAYTITPPSYVAAAAGGAASVAIATTPACPWTAASNVPWLTLTPAAGSGPASVTVTVAGTSGKARTGTAVIAGQSFSVAQSQGCSYAVQPANTSIGAAGGNVTVNVASNAECDWTATANDSWITVQGLARGSGPATVTLAVAATSGPSRSGSATVAGQRVTISQTQGCSYTIAPESASAASAASTGKVTVTTSAGCNWTASSNDAWLTISAGSSGSGSGDVQYAVAATSGPARSGTMTIAGRTFTLNQGEGCIYTLSATGATIDDAGGQGTFNVQTGAGCQWTASSAVPWVTITAGASGRGNDTVRFTVPANSGPPRSGAITAGGQTFTVQQGDGCSFALSATGQNVPAGGGTGTVNVTSGGGCGWTATSNANWLTVTSGASGSGNGTVGFSAASHTGPERKGTLTIGGKSFTVTQAESCSFSISPEQVTVGAAAGTSSVSVTAPQGCGWNASVQSPWLAIAAGASGSGNGTVQVSVELNSAGARTGTATIAGRQFTVNQGGGCTYSINPTAQTVPATGGPVTVSVTASASCPWTSTSNVSWLTVPLGSGGSGPGTVQVDAQANSGSPRSGTVTIAGQTLTVSQDSGCTYVVAPEVVPAPAAGANAHIDVTAAASCAWNASSAAGWITIVSPPGGTGPGGLDIATAANSGPARSGTLLVAGRNVVVNQDSGCTVTLTTSSATIAAGGGPGSVAVSSSAGCPWTAVSNAPWISVTAGSPGSGGGNVDFAVEANATGAPRSGTITIGGTAFTVNQQ